MNRDAYCSVRRCGGIGRRKGLKIPRWQHRAGSSPATCMELEMLRMLTNNILSIFLNAEKKETIVSDIRLPNVAIMP